jgi:hypothetical protein
MDNAIDHDPRPDTATCSTASSWSSCSRHEIDRRRLPLPRPLPAHRADHVGSPIYLTDHPRDLVMSGHTYLSTAGYEFTGYAATADSRRHRSTSKASPAPRHHPGRRSAAGCSTVRACYAFATSWAAPVEDQEPITAGIFGKPTLLDDRYQIGGVSLIDVLNQTVGKTYGSAVPEDLLRQEYAGCGISLAANTVTGTLTSVSPARAVFRDSARIGRAPISSAPARSNSPAAERRPEAAGDQEPCGDGTITTHEPFYYLPAMGNTYSMVRGCRKRLSDCQARLGGSNVVNFGGFLYIPNGSTYAQFGNK